MYSYTLTRQSVENNLQCVEIYLLFEKIKHSKLNSELVIRRDN